MNMCRGYFHFLYSKIKKLILLFLFISICFIFIVFQSKICGKFTFAMYDPTLANMAEMSFFNEVDNRAIVNEFREKAVSLLGKEYELAKKAANGFYYCGFFKRENVLRCYRELIDYCEEERICSFNNGSNSGMILNRGMILPDKDFFLKVLVKDYNDSILKELRNNFLKEITVAFYYFNLNLEIIKSYIKKCFDLLDIVKEKCKNNDELSEFKNSLTKKFIENIKSLLKLCFEKDSFLFVTYCLDNENYIKNKNDKYIESLWSKVERLFPYFYEKGNYKLYGFKAYLNEFDQVKIGNYKELDECEKSMAKLKKTFEYIDKLCCSHLGNSYISFFCVDDFWCKYFELK